MTYFISIEELKQNNVINANVDSEYIEPALREAQDIFLREIIGDTLYNTIENKINGNTLTGKYLTLVNQYIKPYLENRMLASLVVPISMKIRNAGVIQQFDQGFNSSNVKDVAYLADYYNGRVEFYENRMTEYLKKNINDIPEYAYSSQNVTNPSQTHTAGTIYLGGGRKRPCGANYGQSGGSVETVDWDNIQNRPDFAEVATSGDYNDLDNRPAIPTVSDATINIYQGSTLKGSFSLNQENGQNINLEAGGSGSTDWNDIQNKPNFATVATSGDYNDLQNKPTIPTVPTDVSAFNNDAGYITQNDVHTFKPIPNGWTVNATMVDLISSITNDNTAVAGEGYLGTVSMSDLPSGLVQCEMQIYVMAVQAGLGKNILFVITSSNTSPYHWEYSSAWSQAGTWRSFGGGGGTVDWTDVQNKPNFATVATSGSYNDLQNKPTIPTVPTDVSAFNNDAGYTTFDGDYNSLTNKPSIPAAQVQSDWNAVSGMGEILNKPSLATVATSGDYNDLQNKPSIPAAQVQSDWNANSGVSQILNKPTIPTVNDSTINIYQGSTLKGSFSLNQSSGQNINLDAGGSSSTDWSDITNKPNFATVATSGSYNDLQDKPSIPAAQVQSDWNAVSGMGEILNKPSLATVATSGSYNDLQDKPTIPTVPTNVSAFNNDAGYTTFDGDYNSLTNKPTIPAAQVQSDWNAVSGMGEILNKPSLATVATSGDYNDLQNKPSIPAAQVQSDWNQVDNSQVDFIKNKPTVYNHWFGTQAQYDLLPTKDINTIYHIEGAAPMQSDWNEADPTSMAYINNKPSIPAAQVQSDWNQSDNTAVDYIKNKPSIPAAQVQSDWNANSGMGEILNKPSLATVATSGNYNDLTNKPTIPVLPSYTTETWTFTLSDQSTVTKTVYLVPSV